MNMRERIWRCIQQQNLDNGGAPIPNTEAGKIADAVLDELMTPTEGMKDSAPASYSESFKLIWPEICADVFTAMIKAAKEGK